MREKILHWAVFRPFSPGTGFLLCCLGQGKLLGRWRRDCMIFVRKGLQLWVGQGCRSRKRGREPGEQGVLGFEERLKKPRFREGE